MYMLGRRRTCSRPSRTWICSAVYATSAPKGLGPCRSRSGSGFLTAIRTAPRARPAAVSALPARRTHGGQLGRTSGLEFYRILNTKKAREGVLTGVFWGPFDGRFPAQDGVVALALEIGVDPARRRHLVEPPDGEVLGLVAEALRVGFRLGDDLLDGLGEGVQRRSALGLRRLDHDGLRDDERKVDRGGVEPSVQERLSDVEGADAFLVKVVGAGDELMHAGPFVRHLEIVLDQLAEVVRRQDGVLGGLAEPVPTHGEDVRVCAHEHDEVAVEATYPPDRPLSLVVDRQRAVAAFPRRS